MPMLKARIFSNDPEKADGLAEVLKQQGYLVEVLRPDQAPGAPADLEIVLEPCSSEDAIRRAADLAQEFDADVVVAPGTLIGARAPEKANADVEAAADVAPAMTESGIEFAQNSTMPEPLEIDEHANREAGYPEWQPSVAEPGFLARAIPRVAVTLAGWATSAREALSSAGDQVREHREHALTRFALLRASREERLLELTQRRIDAQEQASHLTTARKNAAAYLLQLQHESGGVIRTSSRGLSEENIREAPVRPWRVLFESLIERIRPARWDAALAGVASAGALFAVGLAVASFSSKPNLTMSKEPPAAATTVPASSSPQAATISPASKPKAALSHAQSRKPSPAQSSAMVRSRANAGRDREDGNDVVVRHLVSPSPTPKQQAQGWKHFSDIDH